MGSPSQQQHAGPSSSSSSTSSTSSARKLGSSALPQRAVRVPSVETSPMGRMARPILRQQSRCALDFRAEEGGTSDDERRRRTRAVQRCACRAPHAAPIPNESRAHLSFLAPSHQSSPPSITARPQPSWRAAGGGGRTRAAAQRWPTRATAAAKATVRRQSVRIFAEWVLLLSSAPWMAVAACLSKG